MKTNELIKLLQEADPDNECEVCSSNDIIIGVDRMPSYWDGRLMKVERDENHDPVKLSYVSSGNKIKLLIDCFEEAIYDNPDVEVDFGVNNDVRYIDHINNLKSRVKKEMKEFESTAKAIHSDIPIKRSVFEKIKYYFDCRKK